MTEIERKWREEGERKEREKREKREKEGGRGGQTPRCLGSPAPSCQ
jgi:hypothetical protein